MKNSKITKEFVAFILMLSLAAPVASCAKKEAKETEEPETTTTEETTEETSEETSEETTEETTTESSVEETTVETEPEIVLNPNMDRQACRNCDDPYSVLEWRPVSEVIG